MSIFMHYEGITGEVSDKHHHGWIDIENLSWGVQRKITSHTATKGDRESANAEITDLTLTRRMDSATPRLFIESCCGRGKEVIIRLCKTGAGDGTDVYMEYTLKNALISLYRMKAVNQSNTRPREQLVISFQDVEVKYTPYNDDGKAQAALAVGFDTTVNEKH